MEQFEIENNFDEKMNLLFLEGDVGGEGKEEKTLAGNTRVRI